MKDLRALKAGIPTLTQLREEQARMTRVLAEPMPARVVPMPALPVTETLVQEEIACGWTPPESGASSSRSLFVAALAIAILFVVLGGGSLFSSMQQKQQAVSHASSSKAGVSLLMASQRLRRIDQTDCTNGQYASREQCQTWSPSTCSTTSMTEVMDAYGAHLRIADTLAVESSIGKITPDAGLLGQDGIDQTVAHFGFQTQWLSNPTLSQVEAYGNSGYPVIIGFDNARWTGGHWLVVLGSYVDGSGTRYVHLADSSRLNMQNMLEGRFQYYWAGMAVLVTPQGMSATNAPDQVVGAPTISASYINAVLARAGSPAAGTGQALYALGVQYGIDPAFALAFFHHESSYGTAGEARASLSLGNLRCIPTAQCQDGYAWFPSWQAGYQAWYVLIRTLYVQAWGLTTVSAIIPRYAPNSDHNDEAAYIAAVTSDIQQYREGVIV